MKTGLYIHIPFCISKCTYCDFFSIPAAGVPEDYIEALEKEIEIKTRDVEIETVYIGGGTPSLLSKNQLNRICNAIYGKDKKGSQSIEEFTIEVNPDDVAQELLETLSKLPVTRISCGIQSFSQKCLSYCKRRAGTQENFNALDNFKKYWKKNLSLDFIAAVPFETEKSMLEGLSVAVKSGADHISFYSLTIEEETPLGKDYAHGRLDYDFEKADEMWIKGRDFLEKNGFEQYEVSNFCRPGYQCKHNLLYWNHKNYLGCGSGAAQSLYFDDGIAERKQNTCEIERYIESVLKTGISEGTTELVDGKASRFEFFMMGLRKLKGISGHDYKSIFHEELPKEFILKMQNWEKKGLASINGDFYALTRDGILFLNTFLSEL